MMKKSQFLVLLFFSALVITVSCKDKDDDNDFDCTGITFSNDIAPIIESKCATSACHGAGSIVGDYTTYAGLEEKAQNGIMEREVITDRTMPKSGTLTQEELDKFQCWFDDGAPNN